MVQDIKFNGKAGRPLAMFLRIDEVATTYIANYKFWRGAYRNDAERFFRYLVTCLSHESLHLALFRKIDTRRVFGDLTNQEYPIGLKVPVPE
ncbi:MAG: hypothetical protein HYU03_00740 [Thaumarchaeota archaeon]|nr:hypothetical protein [Nitrososphaerota archaeon]